MPSETLEQFGPVYPKTLSAAVSKFRRYAFSAMTRAERQAYGAAVEAAILALQRSEFMRSSAETMPRANCASGTFHSAGNDIDAAIRAKHRAALAACPASERKARTPAKWAELYELAMKAKATT